MSFTFPGNKEWKEKDRMSLCKKNTADFVNLGVSILKDEHEFNKRAGFTKVDDRLPGFFQETLPPHNTTWDFSDEELQQVKQLNL